MAFAFSSHARIWEEGSMNHSLPALFFFKWRSACAHQFHSLGQVQSTMAQWAEMTVDKPFLASCVRARFPSGFSHYAWTTKATLTPVGQGCMPVSCNQPPTLWKNGKVSHMLLANTGGEMDTDLILSTESKLWRKNYLVLPAGNWTHNLPITSLVL